jgi:hypothetical protein
MLTQMQALNLSGLATFIVVWIVVRLRLGLSPFHLWLGSASCGIIACTSMSFLTHSIAGPLADLIVVTAALMAGYCFTLGVRAEAKHSREWFTPTLGGLAAALAMALVLELAVSDMPLRHTLLRGLIALEYLSVFLWIPSLLNTRIPKVSVTLVASLALFVALAVMSNSLLISAAIFTAVVVLVLFSVQRAKATG